MRIETRNKPNMNINTVRVSGARRQRSPSGSSLQAEPGTPSASPLSNTWAVVGSLPLTAHTEFYQMSLFGMVRRLDRSILHRHATFAMFNAKPSSISWFLMIWDLSMNYSLPDPLMILTSPPTKLSFKRSTKANIVDFWEFKLHADASHRDSLIFFKPQF